MSCHKPLGAEDRFCARCGTPTARNTDPDITLVRKSGAAPVVDDNVPTEPNAARSSGAVARPSGEAKAQAANFGDRLQLVLGDEYDIIALQGQGGFARV